MQRKDITAVAMVWLALAPAATAASPCQMDLDGQFARSIVHAVTTYPRFTIFDDVNVQGDGGAVTLTGKVTMPFKKDEIARRVAAVDGVTSVRNEVEVLPVSIVDDNLRQRTARAIYGNSAFWRYAALPNPPIHILVEGSRVTLTGIVDSEVDRTLARSLATGLGEISVTNCLRIVPRPSLF
ncbi:MAG: BON domain-containing protein [Vicinamibacterales bacterium]